MNGTLTIEQAVEILVGIFSAGLGSGQPTYNFIRATDIEDSLLEAVPLLRAAGFTDYEIQNEVLRTIASFP